MKNIKIKVNLRNSFILSIKINMKEYIIQYIAKSNVLKSPKFRGFTC